MYFSFSILHRQTICGLFEPNLESAKIYELFLILLGRNWIPLNLFIDFLSLTMSYPQVSLALIFSSASEFAVRYCNGVILISLFTKNAQNKMISSISGGSSDSHWRWKAYGSWILPNAYSSWLLMFSMRNSQLDFSERMPISFALKDCRPYAFIIKLQIHLKILVEDNHRYRYDGEHNLLLDWLFLSVHELPTLVYFYLYTFLDTKIALSKLYAKLLPTHYSLFMNSKSNQIFRM